MSKDYITLGPTPVSEPCEPHNGNQNKIAKELATYKNQLQRQFPNPDGLPVRFKVKTFQHDFGPYSEIIIEFDDDNEDACTMAYEIEDNLPEEWDEQAKLELELTNHTAQ